MSFAVSRKSALTRLARLAFQARVDKAVCSAASLFHSCFFFFLGGKVGNDVQIPGKLGRADSRPGSKR